MKNPEAENDSRHEVCRSLKPNALKRLSAPTGRRAAILLSNKDVLFLVRLLDQCAVDIAHLEKAYETRALLLEEDISDLKRILKKLRKIDKPFMGALEMLDYGENPVWDLAEEIDNFIEYNGPRKSSRELYETGKLSLPQHFLRLYLTAYWVFYLKEKNFKSGGGKYQRFISEMQGKILAPKQLEKEALRYWISKYWEKPDVKAFGEERIKNISL